MALPTVGELSLNAIHIEAGGNSGTACSINDADIRGLIGKSASQPMAFNEWYGASADSPIVATGGTITASGNTKFHTFTSSGTFTVTNVATGAFSNFISVTVIGGGGRGGSNSGGGGGGGDSSSGSWNADISQLGDGTNYPVTVGAGTAGFYVATEAANNTYAGFSQLLVPGILAFTGSGGGNGASRTVLQADQPQGGDSAGRSGGTGINNNNPDYGVGGGGAGAGGVGGNWNSSGGSLGGSYLTGGLGITVNGGLYGGGGGGGSFSVTPSRYGLGQYGGGNGGAETSYQIATNASNYGGGGGGGGVTASNPSKSGFQGIVVISYTYQ